MDDDLDTPNAVAAAFDLLRDARAAGGEREEALAAAVFTIFEDALGLRLHDDVAPLPPEAIARAQARDDARAAKDWARADTLRAELQSEGWIVEDGPDGTTIRPDELGSGLRGGHGRPPSRWRVGGRSPASLERRQQPKWWLPAGHRSTGHDDRSRPARPRFGDCALPVAAGRRTRGRFAPTS